jgi:hypothetical protein
MKKFKKALALILALVTVFTVISLTSCFENEENANKGESKIVTIVVNGKQTKEYTVDMSGISVDKGLVSVLDALKADVKLDYGITGSMLDYIGDVSNIYETNEYIYIYTSVEKDFDVSEYKQTVKYKDKELTSVGIGALEMTIEDGAVIYVTTIKW